MSTSTRSLYCPACARSVPEWLPGPNGRPGARCPLCQALERHRFLALLLHQLRLVMASSRAVLDVAPQDQVRRLLVQHLGRRYVGLDLAPARQVDVLGDVCGLPFRDDCFDVMICYHVLEHVVDDGSAMREIARVLRPGGIALVQVPHRPGGPTDEDPSAPVEERIRRFGQDDHVRFYGDDFEDRLLRNGLQPWRFQPVDVLDEAERRRMGLAATETVWLCRPSDGEPAPADWTAGLRDPDVGVVGGRRVWRQAGRSGVRHVRRAVSVSPLGPPLRRVRDWIRGRDVAE